MAGGKVDPRGAKGAKGIGRGLGKGLGGKGGTKRHRYDLQMGGPCCDDTLLKVHVTERSCATTLKALVSALQSDEAWRVHKFAFAPKVANRVVFHHLAKPAIRRLARRGGVKRISAQIYDDVRQALRFRLEQIIRDCVTYCEYRQAKTITINDVLHSLRRQGRPIYGFDDIKIGVPAKSGTRA
ncbi:histone-fold-containing protein [Xylaria arbuscula]|nr:histone-fold-containing protein [Xylaria arbuscula]